jgi:ornithine cyclodeaminase/alanine dehydrogenase-like protein (mu-crystallin family)
MILVPGVVAGIPAYTVKVHAKYPARDPAIQGVIILSSLETGETLAIMESGFLTALRTGLAGAIAAVVLARSDARTVAIVGAGAQGILQLEMLLLVRPITRARVYDISALRAGEFAARNRSLLGIEIEPAGKLATAIRDADIVVTATWASEAFLHRDMIGPGTHITTLGADQPGKAEVSADLLRSSCLSVMIANSPPQWDRRAVRVSAQRSSMRNLVKSSLGCIQAARKRTRSRFSAALDWHFRILSLVGSPIRKH